MGCSSPNSNVGGNVETGTEEPRREAEFSKVANLGLSCEFEMDANNQAPDNLVNIPREILDPILKRISRQDIIALGLTCKRFYKTWKTEYTLPKYQQHEDRSFDMAWFLSGWMGPTHRFVNMHGKWQYLNVSIYGGEPNSVAEWKLKDRYLDWEESWRIAEHWRTCNVRVIDNPILPYPFNMGLSWYRKSVAIIEADIDACIDVEDWMFYWNHCMIFKSDKCKDYFALAAGIHFFSEWIVMMDF